MLPAQPPFQRNAEGGWELLEEEAKRLVFTTTDSEGLADKVTFFVRMEEVIDLSKANDASMYCGEVSKHLLQVSLRAVCVWAVCVVLRRGV